MSPVQAGPLRVDGGVDEVEYEDSPFNEARVRNLAGIWGGDIDSEAVSTGSGLASSTIGFEAFGSGPLSEVTFSVARILDQEITVIARDYTSGSLFSHTFAAVGDGSQQAGRTVEEFEVNLDDLFAGLDSMQWTEIAIHNHGGMFGVDPCEACTHYEQLAQEAPNAPSKAAAPEPAAVPRAKNLRSQARPAVACTGA